MMCNDGLAGVMHSPLARALRHLDHYCIVLVRTLKHVSPAKCVIAITYCIEECLYIMCTCNFCTVCTCSLV